MRCNFALMFRLSIYIPKSRSATHRQVITAASKTGFYNTDTQTVTFPDIEHLWLWWDQFSLIVWTAQKYAGFLVSINDRMVVPYSNTFYYCLQSMRDCYHNYTMTSAKSTYCRTECFGCHRLNSVEKTIYPGISRYTAWYAYGRWEDQGRVWTVDKGAITAQLLSEADTMHYNACPQFDAERIRGEVAKLPDRLEINEHWSIVYRPEIGENGYTLEPVTISFNFDKVEPPKEVIPDSPVGGIKPRYNDIPAQEGETETQRIDRILDEILRKKKGGS